MPESEAGADYDLGIEICAFLAVVADVFEVPKEHYSRSIPAHRIRRVVDELRHGVYDAFSTARWGFRV